MLKRLLVLAALGIGVTAGINMTWADNHGHDKKDKTEAKHDHGHDHAHAELGKAAPAFELQDHNGNTVTLAELKGKVVVLEWFNEGCPFVVKFYKEGHMNQWAKAYADKGVVWLAVNSTNTATQESNAKIAKEWNIDRPILNDAAGVVGDLYEAKTTPHMYIINAEGELVYRGAIDSKRSTDTADIASATNYVAQALDEVLAGKAVSKAETDSYGCSVKYKK
jgi:peroxiredoxin